MLLTEPGNGIIESKTYFLNYPEFKNDTYIKLILDKQMVETGFLKETSRFYLEVDRLDPDFIDIDLFSKLESDSLVDQLRRDWDNFSEKNNIRNKFTASIKMDPDRRRLTIEVETKIDVSPSMVLSVLSSFFNNIRSERVTIEDRDAIVQSLRMGGSHK